MPCRLVWRPTGRNGVSSSPTGQHLLNYVHSYISGRQGVNITLFFSVVIVIVIVYVVSVSVVFFFSGGGGDALFLLLFFCFWFFVVPYALPLLRLMLVLFMSESIFY